MKLIKIFLIIILTKPKQENNNLIIKKPNQGREPINHIKKIEETPDKIN